MQLLLRSACANIVLICSYQWALNISEWLALIPLAIAIMFHASVFIVAACRIRMTRVDDALRWTFIAWSVVFLCLASLLLLRHVGGVDPEMIALASATWLCAVLCVAASCTCHVIVRAGREWSDHLFVACTAFWWMFHDPYNPWVQRAGGWPLAPSILLFLVRIMDALDRRKMICVESVGWTFLTVLDAVWVSGNLSSSWFFGLYGCGMIVTVVLVTSCTATSRLFIMPCAVPFFLGYACALSCLEGPNLAVERTLQRADQMAKDFDPDVNTLVHDLGIPEV